MSSLRMSYAKLQVPDMKHEPVISPNVCTLTFGPPCIYIYPDRTVEELKTKREAEPDKFFSIRNTNKVVVSQRTVAIAMTMGLVFNLR